MEQDPSRWGIGGARWEKFVTRGSYCSLTHVVGESLEFHGECLLLEDIDPVQKDDNPRVGEQLVGQDLLINFEGLILEISLKWATLSGGQWRPAYVNELRITDFGEVDEEEDGGGALVEVGPVAAGDVVAGQLEEPEVVECGLGGTTV